MLILTFHPSMSESGGLSLIHVTPLSWIKTKWERDITKPKLLCLSIKHTTFMRMPSKITIRDLLSIRAWALHKFIHRCKAMDSLITRTLEALDATQTILRNKFILLLIEFPKPKKLKECYALITEWPIMEASRHLLSIWHSRVNRD